MNIKKYIFSLLVLISFVSMQGTENDKKEKYYLKWDKKIDVAISKKVVDETNHLRDCLEDYKNEMQDNNVFDIKNMTKHLKLGDGETFFSVIAKQKDIEHFAKFLNNSKSLDFGNLKPIQKIAFTQVSNFLGNEKAVDFAFKELKKAMTDENILKVLQFGANKLFAPLVSGLLPEDMRNSIWKKYAEKNLFTLEKPYFDIKGEINISSVFKTDVNKTIVTPLYWHKDGEKVFVIWEDSLLRIAKSAYARMCDFPVKTNYYKGFFNLKGGIVKEKKSITIKEYKKLSIKAKPSMTGKKYYCGPSGLEKYFFTVEPNFIKLFCSDNDKSLFVLDKSFSNKSFNDYSEDHKFLIDYILVSPKGFDFIVCYCEGESTFKCYKKFSHIKLNFQGDDSSYGNDFKENIIVRGLKLYKEKHKKPYLCDQNDKRMKLLSEEKKEKILELELLKEQTLEEAKIKLAIKISMCL